MKEEKGVIELLRKGPIMNEAEKIEKDWYCKHE